MEIYQELSEIVAKLETRAALVTQDLNTCPSGHLSFERTTKGYVLIQETTENEKRKRHKLSRDKDLAGALLRKEALQDEYELISRNIELLRTTIFQIQDYSPSAEMLKLMNRYKIVEHDLLNRIFDNVTPSNWEMEPYNQSNYKPEEKRQINSRGLRLRSKSELLISEKFYEYGLEFRYEQILEFDGVRVVPDFIVRRNDGKLFIWEHEGFTHDKTYIERQFKKTQLYASQGIVPWDNLIITYDNSDGIIDLRIVDSEIKNKLIV